MKTSLRKDEMIHRWRRMWGKRSEEAVLQGLRPEKGTRQQLWPGADMARQPGKVTAVHEDFPCRSWRGRCWSRYMHGSQWMTPCHSRWMLPEGGAGCEVPLVEQGEKHVCTPPSSLLHWGVLEGGRVVQSEVLE